jgi:hypothetical protein
MPNIIENSSAPMMTGHDRRDGHPAKKEIRVEIPPPKRIPMIPPINVRMIDSMRN